MQDSIRHKGRSCPAQPWKANQVRVAFGTKGDSCWSAWVLVFHDELSAQDEVHCKGTRMIIPRSRWWCAVKSFSKFTMHIWILRLTFEGYEKSSFGQAWLEKSKTGYQNVLCGTHSVQVSPEPLQSRPVASWSIPWSRSVDLCSMNGKDHSTIVNFFSDFYQVDYLWKQEAELLSTKWSNTSVTTGYRTFFYQTRGSRSHLQSFAESWQFPHHPHNTASRTVRRNQLWKSSKRLQTKLKKIKQTCNWQSSSSAIHQRWAWIEVLPNGGRELKSCPMAIGPPDTSTTSSFRNTAQANNLGRYEREIGEEVCERKAFLWSLCKGTAKN